MSGGHFDYAQYKLEDIADEIRNLIAQNENTLLNPEGKYSAETIAKFLEADKTLRLAAVMVQRIDWLVSGDDGEESFHERWNEDIKSLTTAST
jgi:hypothetical protein